LRPLADVPRLRALVAAWAFGSRAPGLGARELSRDLARLSLLLRTLERERSGLASTRTVVSGNGIVVARTVAGDPARELTPTIDTMFRESLLVWDYSAVGRAVPVGRGAEALALGDDGVYQFEALAKLVAGTP
jgi:hypothetical protein